MKKSLCSLLLFTFVSVCSPAGATEPNAVDDSWSGTFLSAEWGFDQKQSFWGIYFEEHNDGRGGRVFTYAPFPEFPQFDLVVLKEGPLRGAGFKYDFNDRSSIRIVEFRNEFVPGSFVGIYYEQRLFWLP